MRWRGLGRGWIGKALVYSLAAALAGGVAGALLGMAGGHLSTRLRLAGAGLLAIPAIALGGWDLARAHLRPLQCDRETPQRWMCAGALRWACRNGATLGLGATTRLGFWLWYVIPLGALLAGRPALGIAIYGGYGLVRGGAVWALLWWSLRNGDTAPIRRSLLERAAVARARVRAAPRRRHRRRPGARPVTDPARRSCRLRRPDRAVPARGVGRGRCAAVGFGHS